MLLTQFIRDRSDVELVRQVNSPRWNSQRAYRLERETLANSPGCLLCNTFDLRRNNERLSSKNGWDPCQEYTRMHSKFCDVEGFYMRLVEDHGDQETGAMIRRLAMRELGRRGLAGFKPVEVGTFIHERMEQHV